MARWSLAWSATAVLRGSKDVFFYVLNQNFEAKAFWGYIEREFGWKRTERPEIRQEDGCELRVFDIKGN